MTRSHWLLVVIIEAVYEGLGMVLSKTALHHSTPHRRYELASQAAIKTVVNDLREQNIHLRERLEEESRERKRMEKRILHVFSKVRRDLPPQDARFSRLMHLTRKSTCIAYSRVWGLSIAEE